MARTESKSFQCHPDDEQNQIDLMQKFYWNLIGSQEIKTVDSHMETRGENLYSVTNTEHYVKLTFSRELDIPHLEKIRKLEREYELLPIPKYPKLFPVSIWLWIIGTFFWGIGLIGWLAYFFMKYQPDKSKADRDYDQLVISRQEIIERLEHLENLPEEENVKSQIKPQQKAV